MRTAWLVAAGALLSSPAWAERHFLIVAGLGGAPRYQARFDEHAAALRESAVRTLGGDERVTVLTGEQADRAALTAELDRLAETLAPSDELAVFLIGHGSFDGEQYKLNLPGPDIDGETLGRLLDAVPARSQLVVNATSASGAVLERWTREGRTLITATRSGFERNATRFAEHWATAMFSQEADANRNGIVTAEEAFAYTVRAVADSFESEGTLASEHPQLVASETAGSFEVALLGERAAATPRVAGLMEERDALEAEIEALRAERDSMEGEAYFDALQELLLQLALVQRQIDDAAAE